MRISVRGLLTTARANGYAIGAFNVYNLEGVLAVIGAAEAEKSPVILQLHPAAFRHGGLPLAAMCESAVREAAVPAALHLDHGSDVGDISSALAAGVDSIMADGSLLPYADNVAFTRRMAALGHEYGSSVEAELGRLSGTEDGLSTSEREARMTDPARAGDFVTATGADSLAVCIGNVHGCYAAEPRLDFDRLAEIRARVEAPLVLHGASGLPEPSVRRAIELGVAKINVNTEVRAAYLRALHRSMAAEAASDLPDLMKSAVAAMQAVVQEKLRLVGSAGRSATARGGAPCAR